MIGKIMLGKFFKGCIQYVLEDKVKTKTQEVQFKGRAEVLVCNFCSGSKRDLVEQFNEVRSLNSKLGKPVMHITLSLSPEDRLERSKLMEIIQDLAREMNFEKNQYLAVSHIDTGQQHIHVVVNRIGLDGKTLSDHNNYQKIAAFCRKMELKYDLKRVLSPRKFLSKEQRLIPRHDQRKETLKKHIEEVLRFSKTIESFQDQMKALGYQVIKGRGISFIDEKGVKIKGSEVGYPLLRIEQQFEKKQELKWRLNDYGQVLENRPKAKGNQQELGKDNEQAKSISRERENMLQLLLKPEKMEEGLDPNFIKNQEKKKRKHRSQHL